MTSRGMLGLLILCFALCKKNQVFQQFANVNFSEINRANRTSTDTNTFAYNNTLNPQMNFWC